MAEIRLTWWSEAIAEIFEGRAVRRHPVTLALAEAVRRRDLTRAGLDGLVDDRFPLIESPAHASEATEARLMALVIQVLDGEGDEAARAAAALRFGGGSRGTANAAARALPVQTFPAIAYAGLAPGGDGATLGRRLRVLWAVLRGRF